VGRGEEEEEEEGSLSAQVISYIRQHLLLSDIIEGFFSI
jgi:hypothetical protein